MPESFPKDYGLRLPRQEIESMADLQESICRAFGVPLLITGEKQADTLTLILEEQRRTNELLLALVEGMAEQEEPDPDAEPEFHLDGTPVR